MALLSIAAYKFMSKPAPVSLPAAPMEGTKAPPTTIQFSKPPAPLLSPTELRKALNSTMDSNSNIRWEAAKLLIQLHTPQADRTLFTMMLQDVDPVIRKNIITELSGRTDREFMANLIRALQDAEPDVRVAALQSLERTGDYAYAGAISGMLQDIDERVRLQALSSLNALQTKKSQGTMERH